MLFKISSLNIVSFKILKSCFEISGAFKIKDSIVIGKAAGKRIIVLPILSLLPVRFSDWEEVNVVVFTVLFSSGAPSYSAHQWSKTPAHPLELTP